MSGPDPDKVIAETRQWVWDFVIGLNLCPFAKHPFEQDRIRYQVCDDNDEQGIYRSILRELDQLSQLSAEQVETSLLIVPQGLESFDAYLDMLDVAEQAIQDCGLEGHFQLASFHPDYCFDGVAEDDPANATNRSPYPMFHLIREASLEAALANYPDPESIPARNVKLLREMAKSDKS